MISILIPCYDYNALKLVENIEKQALLLNIIFEIICIDDGSFSLKNEDNQKINSLVNAKFYEAKKNIGSIKNRLLLAEKAKYDLLLFLDVDCIPASDNFLKNYINYSTNSEVIFGGCIYNNKLEPDRSLRFKFGVLREANTCFNRNKKPYKYVSSRNFLAEKNIIIKILKPIKNNSYGNDYIFGAMLKKNKIDVSHINNPVIVNNVDVNEVFLKKTRDALKNLMHSYKAHELKFHDITILKAYNFLEMFFLKKLFLNITNPIENIIYKNITGNDPKMILFDIYRLRYLCKIR